MILLKKKTNEMASVGNVDLVKIYFPDTGRIRRVKCSFPQLTFGLLESKIREQVLPPNNFTTSYRDDENDLVLVDSDEEIRDAVEQLLGNSDKVLRLYVKAKESSASAVLGPQPVPEPVNPFISLGGGLGLDGLAKNFQEELVKNLSGVSEPNGAAKSFQEELMKNLCGFVEPSVEQRKNGGASSSAEQRVEVHQHIICDGCGVNPIVGDRFKCTSCPDFYFCQNCNSTKPHPHAFQKVPARNGGSGCRRQCGGYGRPRFGAMNVNRGRQEQSSKKVSPASRFVSDVTLFDGTQVLGGSSVCKIWRLRNSGETQWPESTRLIFVGGDSMNGPMDGVSVPALSPGEEVNVSVDFQVPAPAGRYVGYWRLAHYETERPNRFGQ